MREAVLKTISEMGDFARDFVARLNMNKDDATIIGLYGNLGSGKTTFVQAVAKTLGVPGSIQSPTFVIIKNHQLQTTNYKLLVHIDAYRLDNGEDLKKLGWNELVADARNLILIEWADRVSDILPENHTKLFFEFVDENTRKVEVE